MTAERLQSRRIEDLQAELRAFVIERDWDQFHSPKNLAVSLSVEAGELLENFQWLSDQESRALSPEVVAEVAAEMADVLLYLLGLGEKLNIDLVDAGFRKLEVNKLKYPVERSK